MAAAGGLGRVIATPLIVFNLVCTIIILGLSGRYLDRAISGDTKALAGFESNAATPYLITFSIIGGTLAVASYISAFVHLTVWSSESGAASQAAGWIAWLLLVVAFYTSCKEIHIGKEGTKLKVLESFVIILTVTHLISTLVLHIGDHGGAYNNKTHDPAHKTNAADV